MIYNEFRVFAHHKSGHHAVINWIYACINGRLLLRSDPFVGELTEHTINEELINIDCYIYDFQSFDIEAYPKTDFSSLFIEKPKNFKNIIVLRDVYNWVASIYYADLYKNKGYMRWFDLESWKKYAKQFLNKSEYIKNDLVCINYNKWFSDQSYRMSISNLLGINFNEVRDTVTYTKHFCLLNNSSFDGPKLKSDPRKLNVLKRYETFMDDQNFISLFDSEAKDLSHEIFGFSL